MALSKCYIVNRKIDSFLAMRFGWSLQDSEKDMSLRKVASLRGMYDQWAEENGKELLFPDSKKSPNVEELKSAFEKLLEYRSSLSKRTREYLSKRVKRVDQAYDALRHAFDYKTRDARIKYISQLFSSEIDRLTAGKIVSREAVANGFLTTDGEMIGGPTSILEGVYNHLLAQRQTYYDHLLNYKQAFKESLDSGLLNYVGAPTDEEEFKNLVERRYKEYTKILQYWNELTPFVLKDLVAKEGLKIGHKKQYAATTSSDNFNADDIAEKWELSESVRDGWQRNNDMESAYGSVGQRVRRILASIPQLYQKPIYKEEKGLDGSIRRVYQGMEAIPITDDLGNQLFMNPVATHQELLNLISGVQDSKDLMTALCRSELKNGKLVLVRDPITRGVLAKTSWMQPIVELLDHNPKIRTEFLVDFRRNFQPYSIMFEDDKASFGPIRYIKTRILNKPINFLTGRYKLSISRNGKFPEYIKSWGFKPFFEEGGGLIDGDAFFKLRDEVLAWTAEESALSISPLTSRAKDVFVTIDNEQKEVSYEMKREFLLRTFAMLGLEAYVDTIDGILNSSDIYAVRKRLENLFDSTFNTGVLSFLRTKTKEEAIKELSGLQWKSLYNRKGRNPVQEHVNALLDIISKHQYGFRVESRVRYMGNTLYSHVNPSYLGDKLELIGSYVKRNDKEGLLTYLKEHFLDSPFFVDDDYISSNGEKGTVLNMWLREIRNACLDKKVPLAQSVASIFTYERDLGKSDKKFEDFTSKEHAVDMFVHFFADEQLNKGYGSKNSKSLDRKVSALYPMFILGDANVSKYIRAPRVSKPHRVDKNGKEVFDTKAPVDHLEFRLDNTAREEILEQFWNVYLQESRKLNADQNILKLFANGKEVKHNAGEFSVLTFLNPNSSDFNEAWRIPEKERNNKEFVKQAIAKYLDAAAIDGIQRADGKINPSFKAKLESLGVLDEAEVNGKTSYKYISSIASKDNIDDKIRDYYWNTKLATILQLQIMTIDPSFYHGTKDLQKRYKETHAPGTILDIFAEYPDESGNWQRVSDGWERCVYINDIVVNTEITNPKFMETLLRTFAKEEMKKEGSNGEESEVERAIKDGIVHPKQGLEESARENKLKALLGDNYQLYTQYRGNTLTDGQGWRTLSSYRKVMIMAGKWEDAEENAYKTITNIMAQHEIRDSQSGEIVDYSDFTEDEIRTIGELSVVLQPVKPYMFTHEKVQVDVVKKDEYGKDVLDSNGDKVTVKMYQYIPVQHKYAEALIIPALLPKGHKLRDLGFWMDANNVDMVGSTKIAKVGCFGAADLSNVKSREDLYKALSPTREEKKYERRLVRPEKTYTHTVQHTAPDGTVTYTDETTTVPAQYEDVEVGSETIQGNVVIHKLSYQDYRIQTNVPEHINASQLFGTQIRKLIMAGLNAQTDYTSYLEDFDVDFVNLSTSKSDEANKKTRLNGNTLLALYNSLICANILESYSTFEQNAGNIEELSALLQQSTIGNTRESMDNLLSYVVTGNETELQKFMVPLFEGGLEHDAASLILSTFKKIVNKQQISGGSAVQASAFGISGYSEDGDLRFVQDPSNPGNILYAEVEMPFDKSYTIDVKAADGTIVKRKVDLNYEKYCNLDGTLIPTEEVIQKGSKDWKRYQSYTYKRVDGKLVPCSWDDPQAEVHKPLIEQDYPKILSIIAYRIPTESAYSMLNCQIKRFTLKVAGGTIKVPPEGTTIAGFDFDIDKLYFMQREYHRHFNNEVYTESNFSPTDTKSIWDAFYAENEEIKAELAKARKEAERKDPEHLLTKEPIYKNGVNTGYFKEVSVTTLNSYWEAANIEEKFNKKKVDAFAETAQALGITPTISKKQGNSYEYLDSYDFAKRPEDNLRHNRNNLLLDLIQHRLMDPETMKQRYTPGGFEHSREAALKMRVLQFTDIDQITDDTGNIDWKKVDQQIAKIKDKEDPLQDPEPNYDPTDPYTNIVYNQQNQLASKLIGIFANQNTNHAFASLMDEFELVNPIEFCGHSFKDLLHKNDLLEASKINLNVAEFLAASVDAVKDPVLNFLNLNTITADAGAVLARLGYTSEEIGLLFNQPIVLKVCEEALEKGIKASTAIKNAKKFLADKLIKDDFDSKPIADSNTLGTSIVDAIDAQKNGISRDEYLKDNARQQYGILTLFEQIVNTASDISKFVMGTKFTAANAVSSTFGGMFAQQMAVDDFISKFPKSIDEAGDLSYKMVIAKNPRPIVTPIDNSRDVFGMTISEYLKHVRFNPFAYEQAMYDANRKAIRLLCDGWVDNKGVHHPGYFPYMKELYIETRKRIASLSTNDVLNEDIIDTIHRQIPVALLAKQERSLFNGEAQHKADDGTETPWTNREYYREHFAERLSLFLNAHPELQKLPIFSYMLPESEAVARVDKSGKPIKDDNGREIVDEIWTISLQDVGGLDANTEQEIQESWASLVEVDDNGFYKDAELARIGIDLFMYCFYQMAYDYSPNAFMHLAPTAIKDNILVPRAENAPIKKIDQYNLPKPNTKERPSDDVLVWRSSVDGALQRARDEFGAHPTVFNELDGDSFQLHSELSREDVRKLVQAAKSHPELKFKIDMDLSQDELKLFDQNEDVPGGEKVKMDIPSNIYFTEATVEEMNKLESPLSYGKNRTYREFLNDILEGREKGLNIDEFAQMFILNLSDNYSFVLDINRANDRLQEILLGQKEGKGNKRKGGLLNQPGNTLKEKGVYRPYIEIDLTNYDNDRDRNALADIVKVKKQQGVIIEADWAPCIKIDGAYYMAESNTTFGFNKNLGYKMKYRKVTPLGGTKTTEYDNGQTLSPRIQYYSSINAAFENQPTLGTSSTTFTREELENAIYDEWVRQYPDALPEDKANVKSALSSQSEKDLVDTINELRAQYKDGKDVPMLDAEGNESKGC